jgi:hypothetical protein
MAKERDEWVAFKAIVKKGNEAVGDVLREAIKQALPKDIVWAYGLALTVAQFVLEKEKGQVIDVELGICQVLDLKRNRLRCSACPFWKREGCALPSAVKEKSLQVAFDAYKEIWAKLPKKYPEGTVALDAFFNVNSRS